MTFNIHKFESNKSLDIKIMSPDKKTVWSYSAIGTEKETVIEAVNWFKTSGVFKIIVNVDYNDTVRTTRDSIEFKMYGNEYKVSCSIWFTDPKDKKSRYLSDVYIKKYYNSTDSVTLKEKWTPSPNGDPVYAIINNSNHTIYGTMFVGFLWGWVEKYDSSGWKFYKRGGLSGTGAWRDSICPGKSGTSYEGSLIGNDVPFTKGRYKYNVYYTNSTVSMGFTILDNEAVDKNVSNYYLLEREFEIKEE